MQFCRFSSVAAVAREVKETGKIHATFCSNKTTEDIIESLRSDDLFYLIKQVEFVQDIFEILDKMVVCYQRRGILMIAA